MASSEDSIVEVPLPVRGLNTDAQQGAPGYSTDMMNYVAGEPGQLRLRQGAVAKTSIRQAFAGTPPAYQHAFFIDGAGTPTARFSDTSTTPLDVATGTTPTWDMDTAVPVGVAQYGDLSLVTYMDGNKTAMQPYAGWGAPPSLTGASRFQLRTLLMRADGSAYWAEQACPQLFNEYFVPPWGYSVQVAGLTIWKSPKPHAANLFSAGSKTRGGGLYCWGGAYVNAYTYPLTRPITAPGGGPFTVGQKTFQVSTTMGTNFMGLLARVTNSEPTYGWQDVYRISGVSTNGLIGTFDDMYGKGVPAWQSRPASPTIRVTHTAPLTGAPYGVDAIAAFQDRLFTMGGRATIGKLESEDQRSFHDKLLRWSYPSVPDYFPSENYIELTDAPRGACTGMQSAGDSLLIHFTRGTMILTGYDEDSFQIQRLHGSPGCVDERACTYHNGRAYWLAADGVYSWGGSGAPVRDSAPSLGAGVSSWIVARQEPRETGSVYPALGTSGDNVLITVPDGTMTADPVSPGWTNPVLKMADGLALNVRSGAWWRWHFPGTVNFNGVDGVDAFSSVKYWNAPYLFVNTPQGVTFSLCPAGILKVDQCFRAGDLPDNRSLWGVDQTGTDFVNDPPEEFPRSYNRMTPSTDVLFTGTSLAPTTSTIPVTGYVTLGPLQPQRGSTVRLRGVEVDHSSLWAGTLPIPGPPDPLYVTVRSDSAGLVPGNGDLWGALDENVTPAGKMVEYNGRMFTKRFRPPVDSVAAQDLAATRYSLVVSTAIPGGAVPSMTAHRLLGVYVQLRGGVRPMRAQRGGN